MLFNEKELRYFYRLLNHGSNASRVHCQDPNKKGPAGVIHTTNVRGEDAIVEWAKKHNGQGQCYISRNGMLGWNQPDKFTTLTFDLDPIYDKTKGAKDVEVDAAIKAGRRILEKYPAGHLATSGNGILLVYPLLQDYSRELNGTLQPAYIRLTEEIKGWIEKEFPVHVDILADAERLVRLIGTVNVKGDKTNHRISRFLYIPPQGKAQTSPMWPRLRQLASQPKEKVSMAPKAYDPWVVEALKGLPAGAKHNTIIRLAGFFGGKHIPIEIAKKLILEANTNAQDTPAAEEDVIYRVEDVYKRIRTGRYDSEAVDEGSGPVEISVGQLHEDDTAYLQDLQRRSQFQTPEIPWPFEDLNRMVWGLPRGTITVLGAWTGKGKTSIAMTVAEYITQIGKSVLYFPTEMSQKEIKDRYISVTSGILNINLFNGQAMKNPQDTHKLLAALNVLKDRKFFLPKTDMPRLSLYELKRSLDKAKPDLLIVDYLQRLGAREQSRRREVGEFIMGLKDEVSKRQIACLVLSQFHRPERARNGKYLPPTLFDFAECGDIENTADISILLYPPLDEDGYIIDTNLDRVKPVICSVAKNRHAGTTGITYLSVDILTTKFSQA